MTNSTTERFLFFLAYYYRRFFSKRREGDAFRRKFYRITRWRSVAVISETEEELIVRPKKNKPGDLRLCVRKGNSSDILVFGQVYMEKEYKALSKKIKGAEIRFVIDAGANVGFTSLYLQQYFKDAFFLVVEPDVKNMEQLKKNFQLNKLENYQAHLAGLWSSDSWLKIHKDANDDKEWAYYVTASKQPTDLEGISLQVLLDKSGFDVIDILKIDIEGGEKELFSKVEDISAVLQKTRFLALEIHDHMADRQHILSVLKKNNFTCVDYKELTIATNQSLAR
jgi:FkbM family methyltransferase